ncbi:hypothetical protein [Streptomyces sp. NPDC086989]|uniref:hypothetical protein n=1 Tax=Streptomyces sp. NPDC086989 TaxID=3365764 RepID=UPI0037F5E957
MTVPADLHMIEGSGTEALWLLEGSAQGRLIHVRRELAVVRPAAHVNLRPAPPSNGLVLKAEFLKKA